ncbi:CYTH domain-containing protein [Gallaecimonas sp. GXIMD1310]|uniref:CYTH and CHAD domain-containing protein n=1 Tax=Gallaecimonas sp. GXIMD1310 TaxID=3131926 RepID=UPI00324F047E
MMATETELKLRLAEAVDADTLLAELLPDAPVQQLKNTYFDTPDGQLAAWRMGLRIREVAGQREQTLKLAGTDGSALSARPEFNLPVSGDKPDLRAFERSIWPEDTDIEALNAALVPVFSTDFQRQAGLVADGQLELAWDQGEISAASRCLSLRELELELKGDDVSQLFIVAERLLVDGVQCFGLSKAARGNWLAGDKPALSLAEPNPDINRQMNNEQVLGQALQAALTQWQQAEDVFLLQPGWKPLMAIARALQYFRQVLSLFGALVPRKASSELRQECQWLADLLAQAQTQARLSKLLSAKASYLKKLSIGEELREIAEQRHQELPTMGDFTTLFASQRANRLKLMALRFVTLKGWRARLDDKALAELDKPIKWFADTQLARAQAELKRNLVKGLSVAGYLDQQSRISRFLAACRTFAALYDNEQANDMQEQWQDLLEGIEEGLRLDGLAQLASRLDMTDDDAEQFEGWLTRKRQSLLTAMEQSRQLCLEQLPFWP